MNLVKKIDWDSLTREQAIEEAKIIEYAANMLLALVLLTAIDPEVGVRQCIGVSSDLNNMERVN